MTERKATGRAWRRLYGRPETNVATNVEQERRRWDMGRSMAGFWGAGMITVLIAYALTDGASIRRVFAADVLLAAAVVGHVSLRRWRLTDLEAHLGLVAGTLTVTATVYVLAGRGAGAFAGLYVWVTLYAFHFFGRRYASAHLAFVGVCAGLGLCLPSGLRGLVPWVLALGTNGGVAIVVGALTGRVELGRTDPLTGALNRRGWEEALPRELARSRRLGVPVAMAMLDLDGLKQVNDSEGHLAGDALLQRAVAAWSEQLREVDLFARLGGDEFVILLPNCDVQAAGRVLDRLRRRRAPGVEFSAGVVGWDGRESAEALTDRADRVLYGAKRSGGRQTRETPTVHEARQASAADEAVPGS